MVMAGTLRVAVSLAGGLLCLCVWAVTWDEYQLRMHQIRQDVMLIACMSFFWAVLYYSASTWRNMSTQDVHLTPHLPHTQRPVTQEGLPEHQAVLKVELPEYKVVSTEKLPEGQVLSTQKLPEDKLIASEKLLEDQVSNTEGYQGLYTTNWTMGEVDSERYHGLYDPNGGMDDSDESTVLWLGVGAYLSCSLLCHLLLVLLNLLHMEHLLGYLYFLHQVGEELNTHPTPAQSLILLTPLFVIFVNVSVSVVFLLQLLLTGSVRSPSRHVYGRRLIQPV